MITSNQYRGRSYLLRFLHVPLHFNGPLLGHECIVNAELSHVLTFLNRYYQLDESNYHEIRRMFIDMGMDKVDEYTKGEPKGV